jgi:HRD ubiquitin ligase complex, ER membrane component
MNFENNPIEPEHPTLPRSNVPSTMNRENGPMNPATDSTRVATNQRSVSLMYVAFSVFVATLAIVSPPGRIEHHHKSFQKAKVTTGLHGDIQSSVRKLIDQQDGEVKDAHPQPKFKTMDQIAKAAATAVFADVSTSKQRGKHALLKTRDENGESPSKNVVSAMISEDTSNISTFGFGKQQRESSQHNQKHDIQKHGNIPAWLRWIDFIPKNKISSNAGKKQELDDSRSFGFILKILCKFVDPLLIEWVQSTFSPNQSSRVIDSSMVATEIVDKILTSTPRIVSIINLLLAVTYLLHSVVATLFLGDAVVMTMDNSEHDFVGDATLVGMGGVGISASDRLHRSGRERLGGYLLFKLLLITAVVEPDVLDLLILLVRYTILAFLRSLSYLAGVTVSHTSVSGQSPHKGVLRLLITVILCDISAASTCAALFHSAGLGMVLLLTCDCVLLALDALTHICRYVQQTLEEKHQEQLSSLERKHFEIWENRKNENYQESEEASLREEVRLMTLRIDQEMEFLEQKHAKSHWLLEYSAFLLEVNALMITVVHFIHVWFLHGVTFNLVDGVLALHIHSAFSAVTRKIAERRNHYRIAQELNIHFNDATEMELKKASSSGDVCCICLGTMSMGNVKKVACGHLYHAHCLREVIERAHSFEAARCPLCRASVLGGRQTMNTNEQNSVNPLTLFQGPGIVTNDRLAPNTEGEDNPDHVGNPIESRGATPTTALPPMINNGTPQDERALFRFSTEGMLPAWLPIPAFSFEVVRRYPAGSDAMIGANPSAQAPHSEQPSGNPTRVEHSTQHPSMLRRFLTFSGAMPMSEEEENISVAQLSDMFPQYARADLLRELRAHGSTEDVVESILGGAFTGIRSEGPILASDETDSSRGNTQYEDEDRSHISDHRMQRSGNMSLSEVIHGEHENSQIME